MILSKLTITDNELNALAKLKSHFRSIPFYKKYQETDINLISLENMLNSLPILSKNDLIDLKEELYALPFSKISLFSETSGTTGQPLLTPRGQDEIRWNKHNLTHAFLENLSPETDRVLILHPSLLSPFVEVCALALKDIGIGYVKAFPIPKICDYKRISKVITDYKITCIMSTPTLIYKLIYEITKNCNKVIPDSLVKFLLTGENITESNINNLNKIIDKSGDNVYRFVYGSSESATLMYGTKKNAYRTYKKDFIFEIVPIAEREENNINSITGKLLVTWLRDGIAPLIRYDTNDIFTVWYDKEINDWLFFPKGRMHKSEFTLRDEEIIEDTIYSLNCNVYHFDVFAKNNNININIITNQVDTMKYKIFEKLIKKNLEYLKKEIAVIFNDKDNSFYHFSPTPKTLKFKC